MLRRPPRSTLFPYTTLFRSEEAHDYRYFPDPDLLPLEFDRAYVEELGKHLPELPDDKKRSEEHTSELQSRGHLVCRLLLEKKKKTNIKEDLCQLHRESRHKH